MPNIQINTSGAYTDPSTAGLYEEENEDCPHCGSDRKVHEHYSTIDGKDYYRCIDCDEFYSL